LPSVRRSFRRPFTQKILVEKEEHSEPRRVEKEESTENSTSRDANDGDAGGEKTDSGQERESCENGIVGAQKNWKLGRGKITSRPNGLLARGGLQKTRRYSQPEAEAGPQHERYLGRRECVVEALPHSRVRKPPTSRILKRS